MNTPLWFAAALVVALAQEGQPTAIPQGARTLDAVHSKQAEVGQNYRGTLDAPVFAEGQEVAAKGADCVLRVVENKSAGKITRNKQLQLVSPRFA